MALTKLGFDGRPVCEVEEHESYVFADYLVPVQDTLPPTGDLRRDRMRATRWVAVCHTHEHYGEHEEDARKGVRRNRYMLGRPE
jgi:hypothetical protein